MLYAAYELNRLASSPVLATTKTLAGGLIRDFIRTSRTDPDTGRRTTEVPARAVVTAEVA